MIAPAIQFALYRGNDVVLSGRRRDDRNEPLVRPGQEYTFDVPISRGNDDAWIPIDPAEISSLVWDDGFVEGDQGVADKEQQFRRGRADRTALRNWLTGQIAEYEAWLDRLTQ